MHGLGKGCGWGVAALCAGLAGAALGADGCANRGELDTMYCDVNKDMVADVPTDPKKWRNPSTKAATAASGTGFRTRPNNPQAPEKSRFHKAWPGSLSRAGCSTRATSGRVASQRAKVRPVS